MKTELHTLVKQLSELFSKYQICLLIDGPEGSGYIEMYKLLHKYFPRYHYMVNTHRALNRSTQQTVPERTFNTIVDCISHDKPVDDDVFLPILMSEVQRGLTTGKFISIKKLLDQPQLNKLKEMLAIQTHKVPLICIKLECTLQAEIRRTIKEYQENHEWHPINDDSYETTMDHTHHTDHMEEKDEKKADEEKDKKQQTEIKNKKIQLLAELAHVRSQIQLSKDQDSGTSDAVDELTSKLHEFLTTLDEEIEDEKFEDNDDVIDFDDGLDLIGYEHIDDDSVFASHEFVFVNALEACIANKVKRRQQEFKNWARSEFITIDSNRKNSAVFTDILRRIKYEIETAFSKEIQQDKDTKSTMTSSVIKNSNDNLAVGTKANATNYLSLQ